MPAAIEAVKDPMGEENMQQPPGHGLWGAAKEEHGSVPPLAALSSVHVCV